MQDYVSAQTYAMRSAATGRFGYAWSPKNLAGVPDTTFNAQTDALLVRLAAAIADSGDTPEAACGAAWCTGSLDGATATTAWRTFGAWKPSRLAFTTPEQTVAPGAASTPLTVELQTSHRHPVHGGRAGDGRALVVLVDRRARDDPRRPLDGDADDADRLGGELDELLLPRRRCRLGHDHSRRRGEGVGNPGGHRRHGASLSPGFPATLGRRRAGA